MRSASYGGQPVKKQAAREISPKFFRPTWTVTLSYIFANNSDTLFLKFLFGISGPLGLLPSHKARVFLPSKPLVKLGVRIPLGFCNGFLVASLKF